MDVNGWGVEAPATAGGVLKWGGTRNNPQWLDGLYNFIYYIPFGYDIHSSPWKENHHV